MPIRSALKRQIGARMPIRSALKRQIGARMPIRSAALSPKCKLYAPSQHGANLQIVCTLSVRRRNPCRDSICTGCGACDSRRNHTATPWTRLPLFKGNAIFPPSDVCKFPLPASGNVGTAKTCGRTPSAPLFSKSTTCTCHAGALCMALDVSLTCSSILLIRHSSSSCTSGLETKAGACGGGACGGGAMAIDTVIAAAGEVEGNDRATMIAQACAPSTGDANCAMCNVL